MRNQINNTSNPSYIDLSGITTYGELKNVLPSTGHSRVPGINQLRDKAVCLLRRDTGSSVIEIYDNGFYIFMECERETVYGVDRCEWPSTYTEDGKGSKKPLDFSPYPWELILESAGSVRLAHNADSREAYQGGISIDAPEEEKMAELRKAQRTRMKMIIEKLTEKQRTIMMLDRVEKLTQEQIAARMGISRRTLREHLEAIEKKLNKYTENTRH